MRSLCWRCPGLIELWHGWLDQQFCSLHQFYIHFRLQRWSQKLSWSQRCTDSKYKSWEQSWGAPGCWRWLWKSGSQDVCQVMERSWWIRWLQVWCSRRREWQWRWGPWPASAPLDSAVTSCEMFLRSVSPTLASSWWGSQMISRKRKRQNINPLCSTLNDLTKGWQNLNPLSHFNATLALKVRQLNYSLCR